MLMLVSYDVNMKDDEDGPRRLRRVARQCQNYGQRVQYSVFEIDVDAATWIEVKAKLIAEIDQEVDSLRFYRLGRNGKAKIEHVGAKTPNDFEETLVI